jgi:hypothetical protein
MKTPLFLLLITTFLLAPIPLFATEQLPQTVQAQTTKPLIPMGTATYRKYGFSIYHITLWTIDGTFNEQKPYALEMHYLRDLSKDTLVDAVTDNMRDENIVNDETLEGWRQKLDDALTDVKEGDVIVSVNLPNKEKSPLFLNDKVVLWSGDKTFNKAFADIWLGTHADEDLRDKLLASEKK